jgi:ribosome-associated protein
MSSERAAEPAQGPEGPSKSERKRRASRLQALGVELAALPEAELEGLDLPDTLRIALRELRRLTSHGAQLRQRQYIGKLMRRVDPEPIIERLAARKRAHDAKLRPLRDAERWRDRLLREPAAAAALLASHPSADRATLEGLLARAAREREAGRPPAAARELFAWLRQLFEGAC